MNKSINLISKLQETMVNSISILVRPIILISTIFLIFSTMGISLTVKPLVNLVLVMLTLYYIYITSKTKIQAKQMSMLISFVIFSILGSLLFLLNIENFMPITKQFINLPFFFDGITMWLIWLSAIVVLVLFLGIAQDSSNFINKFYNNKIRVSYSSILLFIILFATICFTIKNIFIFFIFFEMILLPLVFHIITQGSRVNSTQAVKYLVIFTLVGSIFLWVPIIYMVEILGTADFDSLRWLLVESTNSGTRKFLFISLFLLKIEPL